MLTLKCSNLMARSWMPIPSLEDIHLPILRVLNDASPQNFVDFWDRLYEEDLRYPDKEFLAHLKYNKGETLEPNDVQWLFEWKNKRWVTSTFNPKPVKDNLEHLNSFRFGDPVTIEREVDKLNIGYGLVYRFFICHILNPIVFPIWDTNVCKSYLLINGKEPTDRNAEKFRDDPEGYSNYKNWFNTLVKQVRSKEIDGIEFPSFRLLDRALFSMGEYTRLLYIPEKN